MLQNWCSQRARFFLLSVLPWFGSIVSAHANGVSDLPSWAQSRAEPSRIAIVVGISDYSANDGGAAPGIPSDLPSPEIDATQFSSVLQGFGFQVYRPDSNKYSDIISIIKSVWQTIEPGDIVVFYYSGHGVQFRGTNYIVPADVGMIADEEVPLKLIPEDTLLSHLTARDPAYFAMFLDACRTNPFRSESLVSSSIAVESDGLAKGANTPDRNWTSFLTGYAAAANKVSWSALSPTETNMPSVMTRFLLKHITEKGISLDEVWTRTTREVKVATQPTSPQDSRTIQQPQVYGVPAGAFFLSPSEQEISESEEDWIETVKNDDASLYADYLLKWPGSSYWQAAHQRLARLTGGTGSDIVIAGNITRMVTARRALDGFTYNPRATFSELQTADASRLGVPDARETYSGVIEPLSAVTGYRNATAVRTSRDVLVHAAPSATAPSISIPAGKPVAVLEYNQGTRWARVLQENGEIGFIAGVEQNVVDPADTLILQYSDGSSQAELPQESVRALDGLASSLRDSNARIRLTMSPASVGDRGWARSRQITRLRALRLQRRLFELGVARDRVQIVLPEQDDGGTLTDAGTLTVLQPAGGR